MFLRHHVGRCNSCRLNGLAVLYAWLVICLWTICAMHISFADVYMCVCVSNLLCILCEQLWSCQCRPVTASGSQTDVSAKIMCYFPIPIIWVQFVHPFEKHSCRYSSVEQKGKKKELKCVRKTSSLLVIVTKIGVDLMLFDLLCTLCCCSVKK